MDGFAEAYARALGPQYPQVEFLLAEGAEAAIPLMPQADALFAFAPSVKDEMFSAASNLQWIQALTTGVDTLWAMPSLRPDVLVTNARGIHGPQMAEMAFLYMLALCRDWRRMQANQANRIWERRPQRLLWRRTVAIIGLGVIAEALARRAKAFDMRVVGVTEIRREVAGFDQVYARAEMAHAVAEADFVVVLAPYSAATHHMIGAEVLAAMRADACLINLARGGVLDEEALLDALNAGGIAGAGLDVFATEPLPPASPFWDHPRVILTPHVGGMSDIYEAQVMPILEHNLAAFLNGRPDDLQNRAQRPAQRVTDDA